MKSRAGHEKPSTAGNAEQDMTRLKNSEGRAQASRSDNLDLGFLVSFELKTNQSGFGFL
jgi:hypothetical protein